MDVSIWTKTFWKGASERAFWAVTAYLTSDGVLAGFFDVHTSWKVKLVGALTVVLFSIGKSSAVNASGAGPTGSASAVYDRPADVKASDGS